MAQNNKPLQRQSGLYVVEFALVSSVFFFILFSAIEVSRLMYTWSALGAVTQRGARVAAICPLNNANITQTAIFSDGSGSTVIPGFTAANVSVRYLTAGGASTSNKSDVRYVEVSIINYQHQTLIPETIANFVAPLLTAPPFTTTRPAESLGTHPGGDPFC